MAATIQVRADDELKAKSDELFKELGTDREKRPCRGFPYPHGRFLPYSWQPHIIYAPGRN